jgi:hypothetical protein
MIKYEVTWISPSVNSKNEIDFALLFTLRESRRTSDPALFRLRRTVGYYGFTLDAWPLKPSGFCNVEVK